MTTPPEADPTEWTPVKPRRPSDDDRTAIGEELDNIRINLGLSVRAMAEKIEVDRETLRRVFAGDPTVRDSKCRTIAKRIRELDAEMTSERAEETEQPRTVEFRLPNVAGGMVVSGPVEDIAALEASVDRLIRRYMDENPSTPD